MTPVGATCGPTSETFCGRGQGECLAQGGPHVDSLSDHRAGHGTFSGGRRGWRGSHESCSAPLYPVRFLHAGSQLSLKRPRSSASPRPAPGPCPLPGMPFPSFSRLRLPAQARGCLPGEKPPGLLRRQRWPRANAIVALWPPTKSEFLKSRFSFPW